MNTKRTCAVLLAVASLLVCSCSSIPKNAAATIQERPERMFWEIQSPSGTTIYALGTIHLGNEEIANLDPAILELFRTADARYGELSMADMANMQTHLTLRLQQELLLDENGGIIPVNALLTEEEMQFLKVLMKTALGEMYSEESFAALSLLPPWYWNNMLDSLSVSMNGYAAEQGVDMVLYQMAIAEGLDIQGLDTIECQLDLLTLGSTQDQVAILKDNIKDLQNGTEQEAIHSMFINYINDDKDALKALIETEDDEIPGLSEEYETLYVQKLINERNKSWADQIVAMLKEEDKTFFIFGGAAHWLYSPSVIEMLVDDGAVVWQ